MPEKTEKKVTRKRAAKKIKKENPVKMLEILGRRIPVQFLDKDVTVQQAQKLIDKDVLGAVCYQERVFLAHSHFAFSILKALKLKDKIYLDGLAYKVVEIGNDALLDKEADFTFATCDFTDDTVKRYYNVKKI